MEPPNPVTRVKIYLQRKKKDRRDIFQAAELQKGNGT